jgi:hypothetical protein
MTVVYGLDSAFAPTPNQAEHYAALGYSFYCGYIYGNTPHVWTPEEIERITNAGMKFVPIAVPLVTNNLSYDEGIDFGNRTLEAMYERGLAGVVCTDIENGLTPTEFVKGVGNSLKAGSAIHMLYGSETTLVACAGEEVELYWLANWLGHQNGVSKAPVDWDMWQAASGSPCDFNLARSDFPFG